jgi:hypothetical protein
MSDSDPQKYNCLDGTLFCSVFCGVKKKHKTCLSTFLWAKLLLVKSLLVLRFLSSLKEKETESKLRRIDILTN